MFQFIKIEKYRRLADKAYNKYLNATNDYMKNKHSKLCEKYSIIDFNLTNNLRRKIKKPEMSNYEFELLVRDQIKRIREGKKV